MNIREKYYQEFDSVEELKELLVDCGYEGTVVLENPDFITAVIGITEDGRLIYDYALMILSLTEEGWTEEDAVDWISYNTVRALPYMGPMAPIILYPIG